MVTAKSLIQRGYNETDNHEFFKGFSKSNIGHYRLWLTKREKKWIPAILSGNPRKIAFNNPISPILIEIESMEELKNIEDQIEKKIQSLK